MPDTPERPEVQDPEESAENEAASADPGTDDPASDPGRPKGPDEIDPELLKLSKPRARIGWLLSLTVVFFCVYVMAQLRGDLLFSQESEEPAALAGPEAVFDAELGSYVEVPAVPDRSYLARVLGNKSSDGHRVAPALGTAGKVWILVDGSPWAGEPSYSEIYRGRLEELEEMPFYRALRQWIEGQTVPRFFEPAAVREALSEDRAEVVAPSGTPVPVSGGAPVVVRQHVAGQALLTVAPTDAYPDEAAWRAALERAGVLEPGQEPETSTPDVGWTYRVERAADEVNALLAEAGLLAARARELYRTYRGTWGELAAGEELQIGGESVPWAEVEAISVSVGREVPEDARIVLGTEHPEDYWYVPPLFVVLALFAALFLWALVRTVRGSVPAKEAAEPGSA